MGNEITIALISAGIPAVVTLITALIQSRGNRKRAAQQSILIWIMHDQLEYEQTGQLPKHYEKIHAEYEEYSRNGGNGIITGEVKKYDDWIRKIEGAVKMRV